MRYYFIAGEASGDLHASNCMNELLKLDPNAEFGFTGGFLMEKVSGRKADINISEMAFMGFIDVLKNLKAIKRNFKKVKESILHFKPDLLILVDYPGFNLRMAKWAHVKEIKTDYYISPTVWAWKENRVEQIKKYTHKLFVILPFEEQFYQKHQHKVYFVGHPLVDAIEQTKPHLLTREAFVKENQLTAQPIICILPGSRIQEIERMLEEMTGVVQRFSDYQFVVAGTENLPKHYYQSLEGKNIKVVFGKTYELMQYSEAGIIKSGTSTLESALFDLPQVVCYKGGGLSFAIGKMLVNVKYISLVNLILDKPVVKELIQNDFSAANITVELKKLLNDSSYRNSILLEYEILKQQLGGAGASVRLAKYLVEDAKRKDSK
jgi:lipid-A-disaccharide synthase